MEVQYRIGELLKSKGQSLSAAESCTGGQISHLITMVSGSSSYYLGSVTSYAIKVKESVLGVPSHVINEHGVVSSEVAAAMAQGVRQLMGSTFSVSTTGLAEGGDEHYPEGTVWIAASGPKGTKTRLFQCDKGRKGNIREFAKAALSFLEECIRKDLI
ncbi:MAG TPA: hypothetical protein DHU72_03190 [Rikenellaceae bacterium]|nr:hypothetical protein [Rikenellaceae bacterium]